MGVRVSVIIPTWNRAAAVVEAVGDVLGQTEPNFEVLVCDDGSTDDTRTRLQAIADPRLVWLDGPRSGCPAAPRNRGIARAGGEWIAFLDSDDRWLPTKLARQLEVASVAGVGAVSSNATRLRDGKPSGTVVDHPRPLIRTADLLSWNPVVCSSMVVRAEVLDRCGGFPEDRAHLAIEDHALWLRVAAITDIAFVPESLVIYRDEPTTSVRARIEASADEQRLALYEGYRQWWRESKQRPALRHRLLVAARCFRSRGRLRAAARKASARGASR
jgi:glycosyltransferase involved in cell wall biosynthesis